MNDKY
jgi:hypothetical protein